MPLPGRSLLAAALLASAAPLPCGGTTGPPIDPAAVAALIRDHDPGSPEWLGALRHFGQPGGRTAIMESLQAEADFPRHALVDALAHPELGVRMAAIEILETLTADDFGFNPWISPDPAGAATDPNHEARAAWRAWADGDDAAEPAAPSLDDDSFAIYLRDIMTGDRDRAERAMRMLEPHGRHAVALIEEFLIDSPGLAESAAAHLRAAQYRITLRPAAGGASGSIAGRLVFGTRDQRINELVSLREYGLATLPILADYLDDPDPLLRETAIDTLLLMGGGRLFPRVRPALETETEANVLHVAIRRFADIEADGIDELLTGWLAHDNENVVVETLDTISKRSRQTSQDHFEMVRQRRRGADNEEPDALTKAVVERASDPSWRIRASAFRAAGRGYMRQAAPMILDGLRDEDEFVQLAAMAAAAALQLDEAVPIMEKIFEEHPARMSVVASGMASMQRPLTTAMLSALERAPPEDLVGMIGSLRSAGSRSEDALVRLCGHSHPDVRSAALAALAAGYRSNDSRAVRDVLAAALRSDDDAARLAVVGNIRLSDLPEARVAEATSRLMAEQHGPTSLDPLYEAFLAPIGQGNAANQGAPPPPREEVAVALHNIALGDVAGVDDDTRVRAALALMRAGSTASVDLIGPQAGALDVAQRVALATALRNLPQRTAQPLVRQLLHDPADQVRREALRTSLADGRTGTLFMLPLGMVAGDNRPFEPWEVYDFSLESAVDSPANATNVGLWAREVLDSDAADDPLRILALTLAPRITLTETEILPMLDDANPLVRRAAALSLMDLATDRPAAAAAIIADPSPYVREAVPAGFMAPSRRNWTIRFTDRHTATMSMPRGQNSPNSQVTPMRPAEEKLLRGLHLGDDSPAVRFSAAFTLMHSAKPIDLTYLLQLASEQPDPDEARGRIASFLSSESERLGASFSPLLLHSDLSRFRPATLESLQRQFGLDTVALASFPRAADTAAEHAAGTAATAQAAEEGTGGEAHPVHLVYFVSPGCPSCDAVTRMLDRTARHMPLEVATHNIRTSDASLLNQALSIRLGVPASQHSIAPSVFTPAGALVGHEITPHTLDALLSRAARFAAPEDWAALTEEELGQAEAVLDDRFRQLTLVYVIAGGLLDGVNPCAFATIIFFLSYLQVARRTPRQILGVGIAFISAIFITYFLAGLVLFQFLSWLDRLSWARHLLNTFFALFALGVAVFSFRDALLARQGRLKDMTLQLPESVKKRIRSTIREGTRQTRYVIAAFVTGVIISLLELACTGQVYAPIIYAVQRGTDNAVAWLLLYNLAFIAPLVVIFALAFCGMGSDVLIEFQRKRTALVKFLLGLLFLALFLFLVFGTRYLPGA